MSAATAMRRRSTRGSSISSVSTPSSPRSTATPPPSSSGASSPASSGMPPTPTELYALHSPLDFRTKWGGPLDAPLYEDPTALGVPHHAPAHQQSESDVMTMLLHSSFDGGFLDPNMDPALSGLHAPYGLEAAQCSPGVMLSDASGGDPWGALNAYAYLDMSPLEPHPPPQLTPSISSSGESSVNSTPQLGHPHFGGGRFGGSAHHVHEPHVAANFAGGLPPYMHQGMDDPRLAAAFAMPFGAAGQLSHLIGHGNGVSQ